MTTKITVLGSGAMATACAILLAEHDDQRVSIWARNPVHAEQMQQTRENKRLLPGVSLPERISVTADIDLALRDSDFIVAAIPSQFLRTTLHEMRPQLNRNRPIVSVIKGIENETFMRPSEIISEVLGSRAVVAVGGPSHAEEIARRMPATVVAASGDLGLARQVQRMFNTERFRVYTNLDLIGVEFAAALKNVIAIAAGISDGLGFGDNAKSSLMTRGLVEMTRFGQRFGAEATTFTGLAGMGDLITTCVSPYGRNRGVGVRLGKGETLTQILTSMEAVAEGVATAKSVFDIAEQEGIEMPITSEVYRVLYENRSVVEATKSLMLRPLRSE
jgi:glycerol-3-phosphate dehydrogenase (NAD(P)+)